MDTFNYRKKNKYQQSIFYKQLHSFNYEEEAAKLFLKYCQEHPDEDIDSLHMQIDIKEYDGHYDDKRYEEYIDIYKEVEEDDTSYNIRIYEIEKKLWKNYEGSLDKVTGDFLDKITIGMDKKAKEQYVKEIAEKMSAYLKRIILRYE